MPRVINDPFHHCMTRRAFDGHRLSITPASFVLRAEEVPVPGREEDLNPGRLGVVTNESAGHKR
jgi:hypothetical protein